jgi:hypothetical protein
MRAMTDRPFISLVPVTVNALVGAEDTIAYGRVDWIVLAGAVAMLVTVTALSLTGHTRLWVPDPLIQLAT